MLKFFLSLLLLVLVAAALGIFLTYIFQRKLLYPAPRGELPLKLPAGVVKHDFTAGYGLYLPPVRRSEDEPAPAIIFAHGNGEWAAHWIEEFQDLADAGLAVLLVEYPGYAGAQGKATLDTMQQLMFDAFALVAEKEEVDGSRIIAHGRSLGGGAAGLLAQQRPVAALVLESTFSTLAKLVGELRYPSVFLKDRYDNLAVVSALDAPVLIYHGRQDELIGVHHATALHEAARESDLILQDCDHNSCPRPWKELLAFLGKYEIISTPNTL